jgi:hypothetical protein
MISVMDIVVCILISLSGVFWLLALICLVYAEIKKRKIGFTDVMILVIPTFICVSTICLPVIYMVKGG